MKKHKHHNRKNQKTKRKSAGTNKGCRYRLHANGAWKPFMVPEGSGGY
jgi:hypothetical protein